MAKRKDELTTPAGAKVPAEVQEYAEFGFGAGWDNVDQTDLAIPFLNLLQDGSPACKKASEQRIDGAEAGFFLNTVTRELFNTDGKGLLIVPCFTEKKVVEWIPRDEGGGGGGFVGVHELDSKVVRDALAAAGGNVTAMKSEAGNDLVQTFYVYALIIKSMDEPEPIGMAMLGCSKTKVKAYKAYMARVRMAKGAAKIPLFANVARLTSVPENRNGNDFFNIALEPANPGPTPEAAVVASRLPAMIDGALNPLMVAAKEFRDGLLAGTQKVDYSQDVGDAAGDDAGGTDKHF